MDSPSLRQPRTRSMSSSSSATPHESLISMSSKFGGRTPVRIYFLDNSSKMFLLEPNSTVYDVIVMILQKLDLSMAPVQIMAQYFSLYESLNGSSIDSPLDFEIKVYDVISKWGDDSESKLVFMIRLFVPSTWGIQYKDVVAARLGQSKETLTLQAHLEAAEILDNQLLHIQYNQCVFNVITGQYPTTPELALELGVYHFIYKFGAYDELRHPLGFLSNRIVEFLPFSHLRGCNIQDWEGRLLNNVRDIQSAHSALTGKRNFDPQRRYVETVMLRLSSCYGCAFFRCSQTQFTTLPNDLYVAIHRQGINLVEKGKSRQILRQFHLQELHRWGFKSGVMFYFEAKLDGKDLSTVEFGTRDGLTMSYLLTDYVHAFMQEGELEKSRGVEVTSLQSNSNGLNDATQISSTLPTTTAATAPTMTATAPPSISPPILTKSHSLPPPPPPPRPVSMSIPQSTSNPLNSSQTSTPTSVQSKQKQLTKSSSMGSQYSTPLHHQSAVKIQSVYRGYALRNEWIKEDAVILIQATYRGYAERCRVALMLEELFQSGQLELLED